MAERNDWDRERDRERSRSDWDRNRDFAEQGRDDWDRERAREAHGRDPRWHQSGQRGPQWGTESRHYWPERGDYSTRGDWGRQGTWSVYGNRADDERENEWRRSQGAGDWGQRNPGEWNQGPGSEWEAGRREPYGRVGESGRMGGYGGGIGSYGGGMGMYSRRGPFAGRGPKGWQRSDERGTARISPKPSAAKWARNPL